MRGNSYRSTVFSCWCSPEVEEGIPLVIGNVHEEHVSEYRNREYYDLKCEGNIMLFFSLCTRMSKRP